MSSTHTFRNLTDKLFHHDSKESTNAHGTVVKETHTKEHLHDKALPSSDLAWKQGEKPILTEKTTIIETKVPVVVAPVAMQAGAPIVHSHTFAPIVETHVNPTVLEQTTRVEKLIEVQPVIHRMVEEPEHHVIEKHIYEKVPSTGPHTITKQAIVEETVKPRIIEEIQPVLHRDVPAPYIKHVEKHLSEHEVLPATHTKEILTEKVELSAEEAISRGLIAPVVAPIVAKEPIIHSHREAAIVDTRLNAAVVETTTRAETVTEIQPIIHREIDAPEVHIIEKHMHETVPMTGPKLIEKQAIIEENIRPKIIEEIVPIVHREVPETFVERVEEHITENVIAPVLESKEVLTEKREVAGVALVADVAAPSAPLVVSATAKPTLKTNLHSTIVEETARPEEVIEVQPIVHREVDAPEVHVIEKHLYEKVPSTGPKQITKQAIVEETVVPKVMEEIRPVVHREVPVAVIEHVEAHTNERSVLKTVETKEVLVDGKPVVAAIPLATTTTTTKLETATKPSGKEWSSSKSSTGLMEKVKEEAGKLKEEVKEKVHNHNQEKKL